MRRTLAGFLLAAGLTGCAGPSDRCMDAGAAGRQIQTYLEGVSWIGKSAAVKSKDYENVYMVALNLSIGGDTEVGVFAVNSLDGDGKVFAVSGFAHQFSNAPYGPDSSAEISPTSDGVEEVASCV